MRDRRVSVPAIAAAVALVAAPVVAAAAEPLRWSFVPGETHRYRLAQQLETAIELGAGGRVVNQVDSTIDIQWTVEEVRPDGAAVIKQRMPRMRIRVTAPNGTDVEFDTDSADEPQGYAAMLAPLLRQVTRAEFTLTMTPRGRIVDVAVPEEFLKALAAAPGAALAGDAFTAEGFKKLVSGASLELPETLAEGVEWTSVAEIDQAQLGRQTIRTSYRYVGPQTVDGVEFEAFAPQLAVEFAGGPAAAEVVDQKSSGQVLFRRDPGHLHSTSLDHEMTLSFAQEGQAVTQQLKQRTVMERQPDDEP